MSARKDRVGRRPRPLTRWTGRVAPWALGAVCAAAVALPQQALAAPAAPAAPAVTFTRLTLIHGWHNYGFGTAKAAVTDISGIVTFKGAISTSPGNLNLGPFILPKAFRPATRVDVPVDTCSANHATLQIDPNGEASLGEEIGTAGNVQCFTSLEGVSFARSGASFTALHLRNGWVNYGLGQAKAAVRVINGVVHLRGSISTSGSNSVPFTLPKGFRPATSVYVPVDLGGANNGRLRIEPSGAVAVEAEKNFSDAAIFTSLDGVTFAMSGTSFTKLSLRNGWTSYGSGTARPAVRIISGIVHFRGAIKTSGSSPFPFVLPKGFRPAATVYVPVDLCLANNGRLIISPTGVVKVQAELNSSDVTCFTSLDGAWFAR